MWKDSRELGRVAGEAAVRLAKGTKLAGLPGTTVWADGPRKVPMTSILLKPVAITKDNLDIVINANWVKRDAVCLGVRPGALKVCG